LTEQVKKLSGREPSEVKEAVAGIRETLKKQERIARYVGDFLTAQVEKVFVEMGGKPFLPKTAFVDDHKDHATAHGRDFEFRPASAMRSNSKVAQAAK